MTKTIKIHNEEKLFKKALEVGCKMAAMQGYPVQDLSATPATKAKALYHFLVEVKQIVPLPEDKEDGPHIKKRLAIWLHSALPDNDPLK
ncbi:DUF5062 family protein [Vibrio mediterranei]|uniref:DUF5062 family protein n=1 Tax=Vibrio barjaei TaxID=1676683 RepID=A0ABW7IDH9_9VIBR